MIKVVCRGFGVALLTP
ncbi:hypothetical protein NB614_02750 [Vibrio parahaemolyticus]|nr:hypothetical protein [Vibrio parahaemolyticus]MCR9873552.1 hypothetical protein [Vibrio parahaemolyticus]MCX8759239.1 hypothetical protein [Vibrio parahaemolyticus]MDG2809597.1 hypothetical protein [Vibrio parahaemolyticus]